MYTSHPTPICHVPSSRPAWMPGVIRSLGRGSLLGAVMGLLAVTPVAAFTVIDMLGREVTLPAPPRRIVSLVPSATELIFALGGEDRLVGRTDYCDYPPEARSKPGVGGLIGPS